MGKRCAFKRVWSLGKQGMSSINVHVKKRIIQPVFFSPYFNCIAPVNDQNAIP